MQEIHSADNPRLKRAIKLRDSARERRKAGRAFLDGIHLVAAYTEHVGAPEEVFVSASGVADAEIAATLTRAGVEPLALSDALFRKLSSVTTPTGIAAIMEIPRPVLSHTASACVLLEDIQDPGNVGSILRSAAAASIEEVYLSRECADAWSPRVLRSAMGAHFALRVFEDVDIAAFARSYLGRVIATAADGSVRVFDSDLTGNVALAFGNEGAGLTRGVREAAHGSVSVPISAQVESLNVAAAAAICLFERVRQERKKVTGKGDGKR